MNRRNKTLALLTAGLTASLLLLPAGRAEITAPDKFKRGMTAYSSGDFGEAARIWSRLAAKGSGKAQSGLGVLYYTGRGVSKDYRQAHNLFLAAAKQSIPEAMMFLSLIYRRGDGVTRSYLISYMWCDIAVAFGHEGATYIRQTIAEYLSESAVLKGQEMSSAWRNFNLK